ncbi:anti-repressor SinI family protein [Evansella halocellulosilytica]|nr:anti-repressor SinI family protein [Evansella halocellulosilytica]
MENYNRTDFDKEWEKLLIEAREIGITPEDVREFLKKNRAVTAV